ncbi:hypothetical protein SAMN04487909_10746 [Aneurinibacillus migulanus]|uniref:Uncharacterized protein n=1 Tax=Aneurinibacillus migulanus TaxID=47500 RepID=A0A1G8N0G4_ANEMI|nr:hypothetical protein SAMN04487909_10746 [Aneurinibacillus migulanus]
MTYGSIISLHSKGVDYPVRPRVDSHHTVPQTGIGSSPARGSVVGRFLPPPSGTAKHLGRREEGDSCCPFSPGWGNCSGRETKHRWIEKNDAYGVRPLCFSHVERVTPRPCLSFPIASIYQYPGLQLCRWSLDALCEGRLLHKLGTDGSYARYQDMRYRSLLQLPSPNYVGL